MVTLVLGAPAVVVRAAEPAVHQPAVSSTLTTPVQKLVDELDSPSQEARDRATTELMVREDLDDSDLAAAMRSARSPEQRLRLHRVALQRFFSALRPTVTSPPDHEAASLGIQLGDLANAQHRIIRPYQQPALKSPAVLVTGTIPGFPAYAWLKPGDLIVALNGEPFTGEIDQARFAQRLKSLDAGSQITLDVLRDGKPQHVKLRLDSLQRLNEVVRTCGRNFEQYPPFQTYVKNLLDQPVNIPQIHVQLPDPPPGATGTAPANTNAALNPGVLRRPRNMVIFRLNRAILRPPLPADAKR